MMYANKRWGHGRVRQLSIRTWCRIVGHDFNRTWEGVKYCRRKCGGMEMRKGV